MSKYLVIATASVVLVMCAAMCAADIYTTQVTNTSSKQWISLRVQPNYAVVNYAVPPQAYNLSMPGTVWKCYRMEQGSNFYQTSQFLLYPEVGSDAQLDPGETAMVTINYTPDGSGNPVSFSFYPQSWPLDGTMVTVTPDDMKDWSLVINTENPGFVTGKICKYGSGFFEANRPLVAEEYNIPMGKGTLYVELDYTGGPGSDATPSTVWLGTDKHNGVPLAGITLNQIKTMKYFGFNSKIPTRTTHGSGWENWQDYWIHPRQPICLEITAEDPNDPTNRLQFWFRPFQTAKVSGDNCGRQNRRWLWYDCVNGTPQIQVTRRWYVYKGLAPDGTTGLDEAYDSWDLLKAVYGNWKLVSTSTTFDPANGQYKSAGWDNTTNPVGTPTCTATGMPINFEVGARKGWSVIYTMENTTPVNWAGYYWGFRGNIDLFTLGIDFNNDGDDADPGELVTYNFEPSESEPDPTIATIMSRDIYNPVIGWPVIVGGTELRGRGPAMENVYHRIVGKVTNIGNTQVRLGFDDGVKPALGYTNVWLVRNINTYYNSAAGYVWPGFGQWWTTWGWLEKSKFFPATPKPYCLWCSYFSLQRLYP